METLPHLSQEQSQLYAAVQLALVKLHLRALLQNKSTMQTQPA